MDAIFGWLNNPIVLTLVALIIKYVPGVRSVISNSLIPIITTALAWLSGILAPAAAHAADPVTAGPLTLAITPINFGLGGMLASVGAAILQFFQSWLLHEGFLRRWLPARPEDSLTHEQAYKKAKA